MDVRCDKCQARYRIDDARVGPAGLTMRCGKCGNTFKVTKEGGAAAPAPAASKPPPAAAPPEDLPGSTMMFQAPKIPPKAAPAPSAPPPAAAPPAGDLPGSTMMFQAPKIPPKAAPPAPAPAKPAQAPAEDSGATMVFGTAPIKISATTSAPAAASPKPAPKAAPADEGAGSTMMFAAAPVKIAPAAAKPAPAAAPARPAPAPKKEAPAPPPAAREEEPAEEERAPDAGDEETARGDESEPARDEPVQARAGESVGDDDVDPSAMTGEASAPAGGEIPHPPARPQPLPKAVLFGAIGLGVVIVLGAIALFLVAKLRNHPPPPAAIALLGESRDLLDKDSLAQFQPALDKDAEAIAKAPRSTFPQAHALQAEIELAWSDALADESQLLSDKSGRLDDDKKKAEADAASQKAAAESKIHLKAALESAKAASALAPSSPEVRLALAGYYRAEKSSANYQRELKKAAAFKADEGQLAAVEGAQLLGEDDGAEKALAKLKTALAADPQNARIEYRIAQAQAALKNDAEEKKALEATLKLSPNHERAKLMLEALKAQADAANPPPAPADGK